MKLDEFAKKHVGKVVSFRNTAPITDYQMFKIRQLEELHGTDFVTRRAAEALDLNYKGLTYPQLRQLSQTQITAIIIAVTDYKPEVKGGIILPDSSYNMPNGDVVVSGKRMSPAYIDKQGNEVVSGTAEMNSSGSVTQSLTLVEEINQAERVRAAIDAREEEDAEMAREEILIDELDIELSGEEFDEAQSAENMANQGTTRAYIDINSGGGAIAASPDQISGGGYIHDLRETPPEHAKPIVIKEIRGRVSGRADRDELPDSPHYFDTDRELPAYSHQLQEIERIRKKHNILYGVMCYEGLGHTVDRNDLTVIQARAVIDGGRSVINKRKEVIGRGMKLMRSKEQLNGEEE